MNKFEKNKKFLKRYLPYSRQLNRLKEKLYQLDSRIESTHSANITGQPGGGLRKELSDDLSKREQLENRINDLVEESNPIKMEILKAIDHLDNPNEANVLEMFFIEDIKLAAVSEQLSYSFRQTTRFYSQGVNHISALKWHTSDKPMSLSKT